MTPRFSEERLCRPERLHKDQGNSDRWRTSSSLSRENLISENYRTLNQLSLKLSKEKDRTTEPGI